MIEYVSLTYTPDGSSRRCTVWAELGMVTGDLLTFYPVNRNGDRPDPLELIVCHRNDCTVIPAVMNRGSAELEVAPGRELGTPPVNFRTPPAWGYPARATHENHRGFVRD